MCTFTTKLYKLRAITVWRPYLYRTINNNSDGWVLIRYTIHLRAQAFVNKQTALLSYMWVDPKYDVAFLQFYFYGNEVACHQYLQSNYNQISQAKTHHSNPKFYSETCLNLYLSPWWFYYLFNQQAFIVGLTAKYQNSLSYNYFKCFCGSTAQKLQKLVI